MDDKHGSSGKEDFWRFRSAYEVIDETVRKSLIRIYQKLDINRQSELTRIVARPTCQRPLG